MQAALRPYATAGVALVGASVIAVSPVIATPTALEEARDAAVHLSALVNPIDAFRPVFDETAGADGFVSIEVSPTRAHDTAGTIADATRLWNELDRPNVMIKVPATQEGLPAIRALTASGVNVNITLLFGVPVYEQVIDAYLSGLEERVAAGGDVARIASVASFCVSSMVPFACSRPNVSITCGRCTTVAFTSWNPSRCGSMLSL